MNLLCVRKNSIKIWGFDTADICSSKLNTWLLKGKLARTKIFNLKVKRVILICNSVKQSKQNQVPNMTIYTSIDAHRYTYI